MGLLTIVRHGQASFLKDDYDQLSPLGEVQARMLAEYWIARGVSFDHVFYGPARRQFGTGEIVAQAFRDRGLPWTEPRSLSQLDEYAGIEVMRTFLPALIEKHDDLRILHEQFRSATEHKAAARAFEKMFQRVTRLWAVGDLHSPDVEAWQVFCDRVSEAVQTMCSAGGRVVAFTSGGVMAAAARVALNLSPLHTLELSWAPRNASYSEFLFSGERFSLSSFNCHPHLDGPEFLTLR